MTTSDDGLREIQLNGKQLVFLFMAVTVVSVVIFLCGVLVGRGVQSRPAVAEALAVQDSAPEADGGSAPATPPATPPTGPTKADDLGYSERLQSTTPAVEKLVPKHDPPKAGTATAGRASAEAATTAAKTDAPATPVADVKPLPPEPKGDGVAIQVAALRGRAEAEGVVTRLKGKGYAAYFVASLPGQPTGFRVRVGKFKTRAEAERVAARLEKEEQFKPWITR